MKTEITRQEALERYVNLMLHKIIMNGHVGFPSTKTIIEIEGGHKITNGLSERLISKAFDKYHLLCIDKSV